MYMAIMWAPAATDSGVAGSVASLAKNAYTGIAGIFAIVAALVILISLFLMLIATDERGVQAGIHRIKIALVCLVAAVLVPTIVNTATTAAQNGNATSIESVNSIGGK